MSSVDEQQNPCVEAEPRNGINVGEEGTYTTGYDGNIGSVNEQSGKGKEHTRSKMALLYVLGFFAVIFLCFTYSIKIGAELPELKDLLVAVIGALSGILGFIVGYYYKSSEDK